MRKTIRSSTPTATSRLVERQRRLWAHAEAIEIAHKQGKPLPADVSEWLHRALRNIACGEDANKVFDVIPEKQGVRRDGFQSELRQKVANSYIAAATENSTGVQKKTTSTALEEFGSAVPSAAKSTIRKNWNKATTDRKPTFTLGRK
jgi:hypothetical protein